MTSATETEVENLRTDILKLKADIRQIGAALGRVARAGVKDVRDGLDARSSRTLGNAERTAGDISEKIDDNPVAAVLAAFGIGMVLGRICACRRPRSTAPRDAA